MFYKAILITTVPLIAFCKSDKDFFITLISLLNLYTSCHLNMSNELGFYIFFI
jgi:hypothetical protein